MRLRSQILLFLFLFGFAPLFAAFAINLPLVLERIEQFYQQAHLENLRADFRDLDQHLASRHEMVSLLSKLPEPGLVMAEADANNTKQVQAARQQYMAWINHILSDRLDIVQLVFFDRQQRLRFALLRDQTSNDWQPIDTPLVEAPQHLKDQAVKTVGHQILISSILITPDFKQTDPRLFMTLQLLAPIDTGNHQDSLGAVMMTIDVGGMARYYRDTRWVTHDGQYLGPVDSDSGNAFDDFPGLQALFNTNQLGLWQGHGQEDVIWVPLLRTTDNQPLWVGRRVDPSPITDIQWAISWRVLVIMLLLVGIIFYLARRIAHRAEQLETRLVNGISDMLERDQPVDFAWSGPQEVRELGDKLTRLSQVHAEHAERLNRHTQELEESNRYKSEFLANVSHELRTPLNSILLLSKLLREDTELGDDRQQKAEVIHAAGADLKSMIDNILDLSRIEAGMSTFSFTPFSPTELLQELYELMKPQFEHKQLEFTLTLDPALPTEIYSDAEKIRQIIKNFLSNAVKFTERGSVDIHAGTAQDGIVITVSDTGIGIPPDKQKVIFDAFRQADGSINRRHGGTGLGLAISQQLAHLLGGHIDVRSQEGAGTRFALTLPVMLDHSHIKTEFIEQPHTDQIQEQAPTRSNRQATKHPSQRPHILIVDADIHNLLRLSTELGAMGYHISGAGDRDEAIETAHDDSELQLVVIGHGMPADTACATIQAIRQIPAYTDLPAIMITDNNTTEACGDNQTDTIKTIAAPADDRQLQSLIQESLPR